MKKTLLYGLLVAILGVATWYAFFKQDENAFSPKEANFSVDNVNDIGVIFMTDLHNNAVKLSRKGETWTLNDTLTPRPDAINLLVEALLKQRPQQPVAAGYHDAAVRELSANHTKVEIYSPSGEKTHTFYVAKTPGYNNVSYMLTEGAKRPFIVDIPLRHLFLGVRYFTDVNEWKSRQLFLGDAPIESLSIAYTDSAQHSFQITREGNGYKVSGNIKPSTPLNKERLSQYLALFQSVYCLGYETEILNPQEALSQSKQVATLTLKRTGKAPESLRVFFRPVNQRTKSAVRIGNNEYDANTFLAVYREKELLVLSRKYVNNMMRYFIEFFESNTQVESQLPQPDTTQA